MTSKDTSRIELPTFTYDCPMTWWLSCDSILLTYNIKNGMERYSHLIRYRFLTLLPPSPRAQCLAVKLTGINEHITFADRVHTTNTSTLAAIEEQPDDSVCATTTKIQQPPPSVSTLLPDLT